MFFNIYMKKGGNAITRALRKRGFWREKNKHSEEYEMVPLGDHKRKLTVRERIINWIANGRKGGKTRRFRKSRSKKRKIKNIFIIYEKYEK